MTTYEFPELSVLVGEDYDLIREFISQVFELLNVKRIDIVENGEKVVELATQNSYDIIFLDLNMPLKDGFEVMMERKNFKGNPIVVALTASTQINIREHCRAAGMDDFLIKPLVWEQLSELLLKHFKSKAVAKD